MRLSLPLVAGGLVFLSAVVGQAQPTPVVLELYTSQGCSSCPPADALLSALAKQDGVIALSLHVDYWDYLGWNDSFGRPEHTARQRDYAKAARKRSIYTPEMIVQGERRLKGHDAAAIVGQIARFQQMPPPVSLDVTRDGDAIEIRVAPREGAAAPADVHVVRFEPSEHVEIAAGENAGQDVTYTNVVTDWRTIARWDGTSPLDLRTDVPADAPVAVIVQRADMGPILSAAELP